MKKESKRSVKAQVAVFVMVALLMVFAIVGFFLLKSKSSDIPTLKENPSGHIKALVEKCTRDALSNAEETVITNAGFLKQDKSLLVNTTSYEMLCYSSAKKELCTNNHPMLLVETQKEIKKYISPKIDACFETIKSELKNYEYSEKTSITNVTILPKIIQVEIKKDLTFNVNEQQIKIDSFKIGYSSPLYDFITLTNQIINQELDCDCGKESCNANLIKLTQFNKPFEILKPIYTSNGDEAFTITEINSGKQFAFAIRNCAY
jgi:hypothetical protein